MLKQRPAGDKSWPIACSDTTLGTADKELDLSGAHLSYGDFKDATFIGAGAIKLNGAGLANADLSGSKLTADGGFGNALIDLSEADLTNVDLSGSELTASTTGNYGSSTIDFTEATLDNADTSGSTLTADIVIGLPPLPPAPPDGYSPPPPSVKTCDGTLIPTTDERAALRHIRTGIVFVVDTTISMGPYIERLREAVQIAHDELKAAGLLDRTSFGLIAYRNDMSREPQKSQLEYVTRVFQPLTCGAEPGRLLDRMGAVKPARVSTRSFSEDAIAGLYEALGGQSADLGPAERMVWEDADARFIFLITDAGALPAGDPQSKYPGVDLAAIHADATGKDVTIFPIHLISKEAQARNNVGPATEQYRLLAMDQGQTNNYKSVAADDVEMYDKIIREAIGEVITTVKKWERGEKLTQLSVPLNPDPETQPIGDLIVNKMFNVQQRFLGRVQGGRAPQFFEAWAADQDLAKPDRMALRASVFLTRNQLSALGQRLEAVLRDAKAAYTDQRTAFQDMQSVTAITAVDPNLDTRSIDSQDKLQAFLERLPYKTRLLTMGPKDWRTLGALRQLTLIGDIEYKLNAYRELSASDCWIDMTPRIPGQTSRRGDPGLEVCAVSLERLP
mgnify:CR=1 FL=1